MNSTRTWLVAFFCTACTLFALPAVAELPEPDHIYYGTPTVFGVAPTEGEIVAVLEGDPEPLATFPVENLAELGGRFVLRIPIDSVDPRRPGSARVGERVNFLINGEFAGSQVIGERGTATLLNLDPSRATTALLSIDDVGFFEGDLTDGPGATFTVTLSEQLDGDVTVDWSTGLPAFGDMASGSGAASCAGAGAADFLEANGQLTIQAGQTTGEITISTCGDLVIEPDEQFEVVLTNPSGATLLDGTGVATIRDDDTPPVVSVSDVVIQEPDNGDTVQAVFVVSLDHPWKDPVAFSYTTQDGSATAGGGDYVAAANSDVILAGSVTTSIAVIVNGDNDPEGEETFLLQISAPTNGATLGDAVGQATILDEQFLLYQEVQKDGLSGITGLDGPRAAVVSGDDAHLYVAADNSLVAFERAGDGTLTHLESYTDGTDGVDGLAGARSVAISSDGTHVYAVGELDDGLAIFDRDAGTGLLTYNSSLFPADFLSDADVLIGPTALALDPGGDHLYVVGTNPNVAGPAAVHWLAVFTRNDTTGALTLEEIEKGEVNDPSDPGGAVTPFEDPVALALSADGEHLYVACNRSNSLAVFGRETGAGGTFGRLDFQSAHQDESGGANKLSGISGVAVSPDGKHVYAAAATDNAVTVFEREDNSAAGTFGDLTVASAVEDGVGANDGLLGATGVAVTPGREDVVYVASVFEPHPDPALSGAGVKGAIAAYRRDPATGALTFIEEKIEQLSGVDGLWQASALAVSGDDQSVYGLGTQDDAVAVFQRDVVAPNDPTTVDSTSHVTSTWSNLDVIDVEWSGATDNGHVGLDGYSVLFDLAAATLPDATVDVAHDEDPHSTSSDPLADSDSHYFHLRTCDKADNCTTTVHLGPFFIDGTEPTDATSLTSDSHTAGVASADSRVEMKWAGADDNLSGLAQYSFFFEAVPPLTTSTSAQCLEVDMLPHTVDDHELLSSPLPNGTYFFHVCARDEAGNWSEGVNFGPIVIQTTDTAAPTVDLVNTVAESSAGELEDAEETGTSISQILLSFSEEMFDPGDPMQVNAVRNPANYRLFEAGLNGVVDSTACGALAGDDQQIAIDMIGYDAGSSTAALFINAEGALNPDGQTLLPGDYRLVACGDLLLDLSGNPLDGDTNGSPAGDLIVDFTVTVKNLLRNPNFDFGDLSFWIDSPPSTPDVAPGPGEDAGGALTSGSTLVEIVGSSTGSVFGIEQCVPLTPNGTDEYELSGWVTTALTNSPTGGPTARGGVQFFTGSECDSGPLTSAQTSAVDGDTAGAWSLMLVQDIIPPATAASALVSFVLDRSADATAEFESYLDDLYFGLERTVIMIFQDGFESGNTSLWSVP